MIYSVVLVSGAQQSDSVFHMFIPFQILFPYRLLTGYWMESPVLSTLLSIYLIYGRVYICMYIWYVYMVYMPRKAYRTLIICHLPTCTGLFLAFYFLYLLLGIHLARITSPSPKHHHIYLEILSSVFKPREFPSWCCRNESD